MNDPIFIKFYLDEDVDVLIASLVSPQGFQVTTTNEAGRKGQSDPEQLEYAIGLQSAIVTHNRIDFEELAQEYFASGKNHYGIVIAVQRQPRDIAKRLLDVLDNFTADEMRNQIIYI